APDGRLGPRSPASGRLRRRGRLRSGAHRGHRHLRAAPAVSARDRGGSGQRTGRAPPGKAHPGTPRQAALALALTLPGEASIYSGPSFPEDTLASSDAILAALQGLKDPST